MSILTNKNILLGVSGSIAAYKSPDIVRRLKDLGAQVKVVVTTGGAQFVSKRSLQTVSQNKIYDDLWDEETELSIGHIKLAKWADAIVIAPASANTIAKICHGKADDLLTTLVLATESKILLAPAMNQQMYKSSATQENLKLLKSRGISIIETDFGEQACGDIGPGRLAEPSKIAIKTSNLFQNNALTGKNVMITLGSTVEALDPVRFISNHSSGKMGMALASTCINSGAKVKLIIGSISTKIDSRADAIFVTSAKDMQTAVLKNLTGIDIFISCAAVTDYRAVNIAKNKIKEKAENISIELVKNPDILKSVTQMKNKIISIGFAAESENIITNGKKKLVEKECNAIIVNDISNPKIGFKSDENEVFFLKKNKCIKIAKNNKNIIAEKILKEIVKIL